MAKKQQKNKFQNPKVYLAIAAAALVLAVSVFIEVWGLSGFLKSEVRGGACFRQDGSCTSMLSGISCGPTTPDNYTKYFPGIACPGPGTFKYLKNKTTVIISTTDAAAQQAAYTQCNASLNNTIDSGAQTICGSNVKAQRWIDPVNSGLYKNQLDYVADCIAVVKCIPVVTPTPSPSPVVAICDTKAEDIIDCATDARCARGGLGEYFCPPGMICKVAGVKEGRSISAGCYAYANGTAQWSTVADMCQKLFFVPRLDEDGEEIRQCFERRRDEYDPVANGGNGNGYVDVGTAEEKTIIRGDCTTGKAACVGQRTCNVGGFTKAGCGNPKKLDDRVACDNYYGSVIFSCNK